MKVLFIGTSHYDYVQDLTYSGLAKLIGPKNIAEYRWNFKYHLPIKTYPKNMGYVAGSAIGAVMASRNNYDVAILASNRPDAIEAYLKALPKIPKRTKLVFIDGGDRPEIGGDIVRLASEGLKNKVLNDRPFDFIFKREYMKNEQYNASTFPFPISFNLDRLPAIANFPKRYDVGFWATESHPIRTKAFDVLAGQFDCDTNGTSKNKKMKNYERRGDVYFNDLGATKISINLRGSGWDTLRYWEVPAVGGFMLSQKLDIAIPNDFEEGKHIAYCQNDLSDMLDVCNYYLKHEGKREEMAKNAQLHAKQYHTDIARAKYLLERIR